MYHRRWVILGVLCTSLMIIVIGNTSLNVALPAMSKSLDLTNSQQQWVVDAYSLVFAGMLFTAGTLGDRFGRKGFMQAGIVLFGARLGATRRSSPTRRPGSSPPVPLMGIGGALVMPATLSILVNCFPSNERAKAIAIWAGIAGGGGALGLVLGGWLIEHFWWGSAFAINVPVTIIALVLGARLRAEQQGPSPSQARPDRRRALDGRSRPVRLRTDRSAALGLGLADQPRCRRCRLAVLAAFVLWELRSSAPMLDVRLFTDRRFSVSSLGMMLDLPDDVRLLLRRQPAVPAGARLRPVRVRPAHAADHAAHDHRRTRAAGLVDRLGARTVVTSGMLLTAAGVFILSLLDAGVRLRSRAGRHDRDGDRHGADDDADDRADHVVGAP